MRSQLLILLSVAILATTATISCGTSTCSPAEGICCSQYGYCGNTTDYCGEGCTAGACKGASTSSVAPTPTPTGTLIGCQLTGCEGSTTGTCCSQYGYCGDTVDHCDKKNNCFSGCWSDSTTSASSSTAKPTRHGPKPTKTRPGPPTKTRPGPPTKPEPTKPNPPPQPTKPPGPGSKGTFVGYYADWTADAKCKITPEMIPAEKYSHINFAFASFDGNSGKLKDLNAALVARVIALKKKNPNLKIMISLGGGGFGSAPWTALTKSQSAQSQFYGSVKAWLEKYKFDGLDIDWEFPVEGEQSKITEFFKKCREALGDRFLLTTAGPSAWSLPQYVPEKWSQYVDFINVMNYDYHGSWSKETGPLSPFDEIEKTMDAYVKRGVPVKKLVYGFANYGTTFTVDGAQAGNHVPASKPGLGGGCANSPGNLGATDIDNMLKSPPAGYRQFWDAAAKMPYATWGKNFVTFENTTSIKYKTDSIKKKGYKGGMLWVMDPSTTISDFIWKELKDHN